MPRCKPRGTRRRSPPLNDRLLDRTPPSSRILGTGSYLPARRVTNQDLADQLARDGIKTSDDWIVRRTGIRARHFRSR